MDEGSSGRQHCCSQALASISTILRSLALRQAHNTNIDDLVSSLPAPYHLPLYHSLHAPLKLLKKLSQKQLETTFRTLHLAFPMLSALPLRTFALTSRFTDASRSTLDLSHALKYTHATCTTTASLLRQSPSLLIAYAPAFHGISPSPRSLDISHNALTDEHADILASVIAPHATSIRSLDISGNPGLCVAALAYLIDPLVHLTRFHGSVPAADASPAALAPLLDVAGFAPALAVLALIFPPLPDPQPPAAAANPDAVHNSQLQPASRHPPAEQPESSDSQPCAPVAAASLTASHPQRFKGLQQLCLVNLPAALEDVMLAEFPLSQLRMLDLSADAHASHIHNFTSAAALKAAAHQPLGIAALATLSDVPTPFPQLKALNLRGRCMHSPHAQAGNASHAMLPAWAPPGQPALTAPFRNLPKLARLDGGSVPVFPATDGPADSTAPGAAEVVPDCTTVSFSAGAGVAAASRVTWQLRALATVATDAPPDLPRAVGMLTALTALEVRGITCRPWHTPQQAAGHAASNPGTGGGMPADAWGRAVLQLTSLHVLTLTHEFMCGEAAAQSAARLAHALSSVRTGLISLDLAWHAPAGRPHPWAHHSDAPLEADSAPRQSLAVSCSDGSGDRGDGAASLPPTGFARLVESLGRLSALTSLTLRVPVSIPWQEIQEQVGHLSALQQLALDACPAAEPDGVAARFPCAASGSAEVLARGPCTVELDLKGTIQGLAHLGALTAIRLSGVGALRTRGIGADAASPSGAAKSLEDARMSSAHEHEVYGVPARGAPGCCANFTGATLEHLKAAARKAVACRAHGGDSSDSEEFRYEGARVPSEALASVCELALAASAGVRVEVGEVCGIVAGMPRLQRLEVVTSGDGLLDAEKRRLWESAGGAPLLRGIQLR